MFVLALQDGLGDDVALLAPDGDQVLCADPTALTDDQLRRWVEEVVARTLAEYVKQL